MLLTLGWGNLLKGLKNKQNKTAILFFIEQSQKRMPGPAGGQGDVVAVGHADERREGKECGVGRKVVMGVKDKKKHLK